MIRITINGKKYSGVYSWNDMTLSRFCDLASIPVPEGYKEFVLADGKFNEDNQATIDSYVEVAMKIKESELDKEFPAYYRKVINCLTDVPEKVHIPDDKVTDLYEYYLKPFVISIIYHTPFIHFYGQLKNYRPDVIRSFEVDGNKFYLPEVVNILGQSIPLANESIITFTEASDMFRGMKLGKDDMHKLALFMAIYCRKKGEEYDEKKVIERKDLFMSSPMSVVWSVFFCIMKRLPDYMTITLLFGALPKTTKDSVSEAWTLRNMAHAD
jgi:hypothetical protein